MKAGRQAEYPEKSSDDELEKIENHRSAASMFVIALQAPVV